MMTRLANIHLFPPLESLVNPAYYLRATEEKLVSQESAAGLELILVFSEHNKPFFLPCYISWLW